MKTVKTLMVLLMFSALSFAQSIYAPPPPTGFNSRYQGTAVSNGTAEYYWLQTNYINGTSSLAGPLTQTVGTLGPTVSDNVVALSWTPVPNAYYTVLKTTSSSPPTGSCTCALKLHGTAPNANDIGQSLQAYVVPTPTSAGFLTFVTATNTATLGAVMGQFITGTPTSAATYTTPTATAIVAAMASCQVGQTYPMYIYNTAGSSLTITLAAGTGVTLVGTMTVAQNDGRSFLVTPTSCSSPAVSIYSTGITIF